MTTPSPSQPPMGSKHRLLLRIERFSRQNYKVVFLLALLALIAGTYLGSKLHLESNILDLVPAGNRQVDTFKEALEDFGSVDYLMLLVEAGPGQGATELGEFADIFAELLRERDELIDLVDYRFELDDQFLELFYENALLFLPPERLPDLAGKLTDFAIEQRVEEIKRNASSPTAAFTLEVVQRDPLGLLPLFLGRLAGNRGLLKVDLTDGYYLSADQQNLIMLVKPTGASQNIDFDRELIAAVHEIERETREAFAEDTGDVGGSQAIGVRYAGNYAIAVDEAELIKKDVGFNLFFSLFAVSSLYWLCYRRFAALLYSSLPLMVGQALTFALCFFVLRELNAASSAFTALLMGLGTDFVIVIYARYIEERQKGATLAVATERMIGETGLGVFTGAITSAGTFYAMCYSQFRGLKDLGFLIGSGILLCAVAILFMLPAMIKWNEGVRPRKVDAVKKLHLQSFGLEYLIPLAARHRVPTLIVVAALTAASVWGAMRLDFEDSVKALRSERSASFKVQQEISERFGVSLSYMMAIAEAPSERQAIELAEDIEQRLEPFLADGTVGSFDSILTYLPAESQQQAVLEAVRADTKDTFASERIRATFLAALDRHGFNSAPFDPFLERMERFLNPARPMRLADLESRDLGRLLERYIRTDDGRTRIVTYLFLSDPRWKRDAPPRLVEELTASDEGIVITGTNVVGAEFRRIFQKEAPRAVMLGLVVVFVLLWVDFRSLRLTAIALSQLICGVIMMLGMMKVAGIHLNYVNSFVATMILGVGIDYSIHLVHRMSMSGGAVDGGLLETGKAVVMAALTNIAGFGTLALGNYPALKSFGLVAMFGSMTCLFTSLTLVPALMAGWKPPEKKAG